MRRHPEIADVLTLHSHLDEGRMGEGVLDAPLVLVSAIAVATSGIGHGTAKRREREDRERKAQSK